MKGKSLLKSFLRHFNRFLIVPVFKMRLGRLISNPLTGKIMVVKVIGRKTGKIRYTPVNYSIIDGNIYCYQGKKLKGQWYLNLKANPNVEVFLSDDNFLGFSEEVKDDRERVDAMRAILKNSGLGGFIYGFNPNTASDKLIEEKTADIHVMKIISYKSKAF